MELPPQPNPSAIEVTCEDNPLTLEWRISPIRKIRGFAAWILVWTSALTLMAAGILNHALHLGLFREAVLDWRLILIATTVLLVVLLVAALLVWRPPSVDVRLVLHDDSLIWVPRKGSAAEVHRRSEVLEVRRQSEVVVLKVETDAQAKDLHLRGLFAPGDAAWLSDVMGRWLSDTLPRS